MWIALTANWGQHTFIHGIKYYAGMYHAQHQAGPAVLHTQADTKPTHPSVWSRLHWHIHSFACTEVLFTTLVYNPAHLNRSYGRPEAKSLQRKFSMSLSRRYGKGAHGAPSYLIHRENGHSISRVSHAVDHTGGSRTWTSGGFLAGTLPRAPVLTRNAYWSGISMRAASANVASHLLAGMACLAALSAISVKFTNCSTTRSFRRGACHAKCTTSCFGVTRLFLVQGILLYLIFSVAKRGPELSTCQGCTKSARRGKPH